jgi:hypothetical protein
MGHPQYLESIERTAIASNARNSLHHYNHNPDFYHLVTSQAQQQLLQNQDTSTTNTNNNTSTQQAFWPFARQASAPPEFMGHQLLPGVNQLAAVSHQHTVSAVRSVYNTADSFLNMLSTSSLNGMNTEALIEAADSFLNTLSTSSLHGMNTVAAYGFNDVAWEELKQAPNRNESSSPCDEFLQSIESSIGPLSPISKLFEGL